MTDWPGSIAATITLSGCSTVCDGCAAGRRLSGPRADWESVVRRLVEERSWLDGIVVAGPEPTEDPDLPSLLAALKEMGLPVRLETNGTRPDVVRLLMAEQLVDFVGLELPTVPERYQSVCGAPGAADRVDLTIALLISGGVDHEFRTVLDPRLVSLDELPRLGSRLRGGRLWALERPRRSVDAASPSPYRDSQLRAAARACSRHLPTVVRGLARPREAA